MKALSKLVISPKEELKKATPPSKKLTHQEVLSGLERGDESVLGYVYNQHVHDLFRFGSQISRDKEVVKDCIQDVFLTLIKRNNIAHGKINSIKSYLYKSLYRAIIEKVRTERKYLLEHPVLDNLDGFEIEISSESRMIDEEAYRLKVIKVNEELKHLSKRQKQAILLFYYDGFSQQEIADLMNLKNQNSVTKLVRRGLDSIRKNILISLLPLLNMVS
ncbi:RNA polymerase sigma factor [Fulvivirgaceae bacterium BMA12]|uniref:RNA polymerase sigma factor n=1 Tax=Agaribacillus aureus TaxID=3051825 RepID=A0ABT8L5B3_9BACT|nr:RNA polymerase sigma factor [Fulvivirgaceae bacterium BMA12]